MGEDSTWRISSTTHAINLVYASIMYQYEHTLPIPGNVSIQHIDRMANKAIR